MRRRRDEHWMVTFADWVGDVTEPLFLFMFAVIQIAAVAVFLVMVVAAVAFLLGVL